LSPQIAPILCGPVHVSRQSHLSRRRVETEQRIKSTTSLRDEKHQSLAYVLPIPGAVRSSHPGENGATNSPLHPSEKRVQKISYIVNNSAVHCLISLKLSRLMHHRLRAPPRKIGGTGHLKWQCSAKCHYSILIILYHFTC